MSRQAMILAAGLGTRLGELTSNQPKALVKYNGKPLLQHVLEKLIQSGFDEIIINVHHYADMIIDFLESNDNFGISVIFSDEGDELLNTGGAILRASKYFTSEDILIHNVDILSSIDLNTLMDYHKLHGKTATLAVKDRKTSRSLLHNKDLFLCGWRDERTGEEINTRPGSDLASIAFSAIYVIKKEFPLNFEESGAFPLIPELLRISETEEIKLFPHNSDNWKDMGKRGAFF